MSDAGALTKTLLIVNKRGLHARAAAKFAKLAATFKSQVSVKRNDMEVPGRSLMGLLTLGASKGKEIQIICEGDDAAEALAALSSLIERGFDENDDDGA